MWSRIGWTGASTALGVHLRNLVLNFGQPRKLRLSGGGVLCRDLHDLTSAKTWRRLASDFADRLPEDFRERVIPRTSPYRLVERSSVIHHRVRHQVVLG